MLTEILEGVTKDADVDAVTNEHIQVMRLVMGILHNCTDISDEFAIAVAKTKVLEMTKNILDTNSNNNNQNDRLEAVITNCHGIAHNVSMREKNVERLRNLDFVTTVAPYLKSKEAMIRISALATLANIVTEKECLIIGNHILVVAQLLMLLNEGMATESRRCNGWSCKECALAIRQLARNDANKQLLNELKALQSLIELAKSKDKEEQIESLLAILALSFNDNIRADMTKTSELGVVDLLLDLKESSDDQKIKSACEKTLWNLKDDLLLSPIPSYKKAGERMQKKNDPDTNTGHIMISYQRNDRKFLLTIRDKLKDSGFKVWMDVDKMGGCVYETMADAVENASIFLMCYSRKYKESDNCQYEAKYAHKKKKTVIPLKMERDYDPDGWLGLLLKSDYFLEFSGKYDTEDKFKELLARIKTLWSHGQDIVDTPVIEKEQQPVLAKTIDEVDAPPKIGPNKFEERRNIPYSARINIIKGWNQQDINKWLESNNLKNQGIDKITALEISLMARMLIEVPEQLYECLRQDLKIKTLSTKAKIVWALDDLVHTEDDKL
ncbi:uncharacterized protein LOC123526741 [Mercenaria mercenaria]|uniref:uncharacterized protein LOC123526741 n=1 Tax=Mercenaria mercenaria TaxID=6596 RepID=UPI00234E4868|nr:uncharacterized protein LOC123526741 [Mercenaria mercenaria]